MKPDTIRTSIDLPRDLHRRLHEAAARRGISARKLILAGIERELADPTSPRPEHRLDLRNNPLIPSAGPASFATPRQTARPQRSGTEN
jgi:hypothetical protein